MRKRLVCLVLRHRWTNTYDLVHRQHGRACRRCGVAEVSLGDLDFNPNLVNPLGLGIGVGL